MVSDVDSTSAGPADYHRIILNFPPDLANEVKALALRERRPVSRQIQVLVEQALRLAQAAA